MISVDENGGAASSEALELTGGASQNSRECINNSSILNEESKAADCKSQDPMTSIGPGENKKIVSTSTSSSDAGNQKCFRESSEVKNVANEIAEDLNTPRHQQLPEKQGHSFSNSMNENDPKIFVSPTPSMQMDSTQKRSAANIQIAPGGASPPNKIEKNHCENYATVSADVNGKYSNIPLPEVCPREVSCSTPANETVDDRSGKVSVGSSLEKLKNGIGKLFSQVFTGSGFRRASSKIPFEEGSAGECAGKGLSPAASTASSDDLPGKESSPQTLDMTVENAVPKRISDLSVIKRPIYTPSRGRQRKNPQKAECEVDSMTRKIKEANGMSQNERAGNNQQNQHHSHRLRPRRSSKRPDRFVAVPSKRGFSAKDGDLVFLLSGDQTCNENGSDSGSTDEGVKDKKNRETCPLDVKKEKAESNPTMTLRSRGNDIEQKEETQPDPKQHTGRRRTRRSSKTPERYIARPSKQGLGADEGDMLFMITRNLSTSRNGRHGTQHGGDQEVPEKGFIKKEESSVEGVMKRRTTQQFGLSDDEIEPLSATIPPSQTTIVQKILVKEEQGSDTIGPSIGCINETPAIGVTSDSSSIPIPNCDAIIDGADAGVQNTSDDDLADSDLGRITRYSVNVKTEKDNCDNRIGSQIIKQEDEKGSCENASNQFTNSDNSTIALSPIRAQVIVEDEQNQLARSARKSRRKRKLECDILANGNSNDARTKNNVTSSTCANTGKITSAKDSESSLAEVNKSSDDEVIFIGKTESLARRTRSMSRYSNKPINKGSDKRDESSFNKDVVLGDLEQTNHACAQDSKNRYPNSRSPRKKRLPLTSTNVSNGDDEDKMTSIKSISINSSQLPRKRRRLSTSATSLQESQDHSTWSNAALQVRRSSRQPIPSPKALASSMKGLETNFSTRPTEASAYDEKQGGIAMKEAFAGSSSSGYKNDSPLLNLQSARVASSPMKTKGLLSKNSTEQNSTPHQSLPPSQEHASDSTVQSPRNSIRQPSSTPKVLESQSPLDEGIPPHPNTSSNTLVKKRGRTRKIRLNENNSNVEDKKGTCSPRSTKVACPEPGSSCAKTDQTPSKSTLMSPSRDSKESCRMTEGSFVVVQRQTLPGCNKQGGAGRVDAVHHEESAKYPTSRSYDADHAVVGSAKSVDEMFVPMVLNIENPPEPIPSNRHQTLATVSSPNDANHTDVTGASTATAPKKVRADDQPQKAALTEPKNYWRCHECGDLVSPAAHCTTCRRPHKNQSYGGDNEIRVSALASRDSYQAQVTRNAVRHGRDFWMCSHCNIGIPSLSMPCGMCRRRISSAVFEGNEFNDFIQKRREQERKRRENLENKMFMAS